MVAKLSKVQKRAYGKLKKSGGWVCPYSLRESMATLDALEKRGLVKVRGYGELGASWSPRTTIEYKAL